MDWRKAWRITGALVLVLALGAAASGAYLWFRYRPTAAQAWDDIAALHASVSIGLRVRWAHRWISRLLVPATILFAVFGVGAARAEGRLGALRVWPPVAGLFAGFTGFLLRWDQLALYAVTVGTDLRGFQALWSDQIRFVLVGGTEVAPGTVRTWAVVHVLLGASLLIGAIAPLLPRRRSGLAHDGGGVLVEPPAEVAGVA